MSAVRNFCSCVIALTVPDPGAHRIQKLVNFVPNGRRKDAFINKGYFTVIKKKAEQFTNLIPLRFPPWPRS